MVFPFIPPLCVNHVLQQNAIIQYITQIGKEIWHSDDWCDCMIQCVVFKSCQMLPTSVLMEFECLYGLSHFIMTVNLSGANAGSQGHFSAKELAGAG